MTGAQKCSTLKWMSFESVSMLVGIVQLDRDSMTPNATAFSASCVIILGFLKVGMSVLAVPVGAVEGVGSSNIYNFCWFGTPKSYTLLVSCCSYSKTSCFLLFASTGESCVLFNLGDFRCCVFLTLVLFPLGSAYHFWAGLVSSVLISVPSEVTIFD